MSDFNDGAFGRLGTKIEDITYTQSSSPGSENGSEKFLNPFLLNLLFTKWACIPSYLVLIFSSVLIVYIVFKKYRAVLNVYFSVLFYIFCQIQFLIVTTVSWISESFKTDTKSESTRNNTSVGHTDDQFEQRCKMMVPFQTYSIILPGYAVLMMTLVRSIFVSRPLSYFDYIRRRYQLLGTGLYIILCGIISSLPCMGALCDIRMNTYDEGGFRYCSYGGSCSIYFTFLVGLGSIIPIVLISFLYIHIYKVTVCARKAHEALTKRQINQKAESSKQNEEVRKESERNANIS